MTYVLALIGTWILAHLWGDYVLQSDYMAGMKTSSAKPAAAHAFVYTCCYSPLFFLSPSLPKTLIALAVIGGTHFVIDRWRLARYVVWAKNFLAPEWSLSAKTDAYGSGPAESYFENFAKLCHGKSQVDALDVEVATGWVRTKPWWEIAKACHRGRSLQYEIDAFWTWGPAPGTSQATIDARAAAVKAYSKFEAKVQEVQGTWFNVNRWHHPWSECQSTGYHSERPAWMAVWLMIIADNTLHLTVNLAAILWAVG